MSWWPWTSVGRLEDAKADAERAREGLDRLRDETNALVDRLRDENRELLDRIGVLTEQLTRIGRREVGLPEEVRQPRPEILPMPDELKEHIEKFGTPQLRKHMRDSYYRLHARGASWTEIMSEAIPKDDDDGR